MSVWPFPPTESDGDSPEWAMEQEETIDSLLCETPSLLPTISLSLASSEDPRGPAGPPLAPVAQTAVSSTISQGKTIKVGENNYIFFKSASSFSGFFCFSDAVCLLYYRLRRRKSSLRLNWSHMKWISSSIFPPKVWTLFILVSSCCCMIGV